MTLKGEYLGMPVAIDDLDTANQDFFRHCASGTLHLQSCVACDLMRYPTGTACPWCGGGDFTWRPVSGRGTVHSYGEVHHAIQPLFRQFSPYLLLLVELDEQRGKPSEFEALRVNGNLATPSGDLAPPELVRQVGIGSRVRVVFKTMGDGLALPLWAIDESAAQPDRVWRYPIE